MDTLASKHRPYSLCARSSPSLRFSGSASSKRPISFTSLRTLPHRLLYLQPRAMYFRPVER